MKQETILRRAGIGVLAQGRNVLDPSGAMHHALSLRSETVNLPGLTLASPFIEHWPIREGPGSASWRQSRYHSISPAVFVLRNAILNSAAGIIGFSGFAVEETMMHASPHRDGFVLKDGSIAIDMQLAGRVSETHISLLSGDCSNYFHAIFDSIAKLSLLPPHLLVAAQGIFLPHDAPSAIEAVRLLGMESSHAIRTLGPNEIVEVERLIYPVSIHGLCHFHPCILALFDRMAAASATRDTGGRPKRLYIDRRAAQARRLVNETQLIESLIPFGFAPIQLESLPLQDQINLFRDAEMIAAPHGAGLANLIFCTKKCQVLELQIDSYANWTFRHLAALMGLRYECIFGRDLGPWTENTAEIHRTAWLLSVPHVVAAVATLVA